MVILIVLLAIAAVFRILAGLAGLTNGEVKYTVHPLWIFLHSGSLLYVLWTLYGMVK